MTWRTRLAVGFLAACLALVGVLILLANPAPSSRGRIPADVFVAVRAEWPTRAERVAAFDVVACETGGAFNTTATNGQYLGLFQMGAWARRRYGHGRTARAQARAARRYYADAGWSPWQACR